MSNAHKLLLLFGGAPTLAQQLINFGALALWTADTNVFQDTDLTDPIQDTELIAGWKDHTGNGNDLTQAGVDTLKLTWDDAYANGDNRPAAVGAGGDYVSRSAAGIVTSRNATTWMATVVFTPSADNAHTVYSEGNTSEANSLLLMDMITTGRMRTLIRNAAGTAAAINGGNNSITVDQPNIVSFVRRVTGTLFEQFANGATQGGTATVLTTITTDRYAIGAQLQAAASNQFSGGIHLVAIFPDESNRLAIEAAIAAYYPTIPL
jgi:hypothetical protein